MMMSHTSKPPQITQIRFTADMRLIKGYSFQRFSWTSVVQIDRSPVTTHLPLNSPDVFYKKIDRKGRALVDYIIKIFPPAVKSVGSGDLSVPNRFRMSRKAEFA